MITLHCPCGAKTEVVGNNQCYNIGQVERFSGWRYGSCSYTQKAVWLCQTCFDKAAELATQIYEITKTPCYPLRYLIPKEIKDDYYQKVNEGLYVREIPANERTP